MAEPRMSIAEAWRHLHNLCAEYEGLLIIKNHLAAIKASYEQPERTLKELHAEIAGLRAEAERLRQENVRTRADDERASQRIRADAAREAKELVEKAHLDREAVDRETAKASRDLQAMRDGLTAEIARLRAVSRDLTDTNATLDRDVTARQATLTDLKRQIAKLRASIPAEA